MSFACVGDISIYFTVSSLIIKPIFFCLHLPVQMIFLLIYAVLMRENKK